MRKKILEAWLVPAKVFLFASASILLSQTAFGKERPVQNDIAWPVSCDLAELRCAAVNLSSLYSAGARVATATCNANDQTCEGERRKALSLAATKYKLARSYIDRSGSITLLGDETKHDVKNASRFYKQIDDRLLYIASKSCQLTKRDCIIADLYLYADIDRAVRSGIPCLKKAAPMACFSIKQSAITTVDRHTTRYVKQVMRAEGWLSSRKWGRTTEDSLALLVQHADADPDFQSLVLSALRSAVAAGTAQPVFLALLEDRVAVHSRKPQIYGTQGECFLSNEQVTWRAAEIANPSRLDERRASLGLGTHKEYVIEAVATCQGA